MGAPSVRLPGETWEELERRLARMRPADFPASARVADTALASLDPEARAAFERMLAARAGAPATGSESWRPTALPSGRLPDGVRRRPHLHRHLEALLGARGGPDRRRRKPESKRTRARWIAFRRWVTGYEGGRFRLIGAPEKSWDWPHVELAGPLGYRSIEALLLAARTADTARLHESLGATVLAAPLEVAS